jgi:hypothetical protein
MNDKSLLKNMCANCVYWFVGGDGGLPEGFEYGICPHWKEDVKPDGACAEFHGIDRDDVAEIIGKG